MLTKVSGCMSRGRHQECEVVGAQATPLAPPRYTRLSGPNAREEASVETPGGPEDSTHPNIENTERGAFMSERNRK